MYIPPITVVWRHEDALLVLPPRALMFLLYIADGKRYLRLVANAKMHAHVCTVNSALVRCRSTVRGAAKYQ